MKKIIFFMVLIGSLGTLSWFYFDNVPTRVIPYPYTFSKQPLIIPNQVKKSSILIVGDQMGHSLHVFQKDLQTLIFGADNSRFSIYNWAQEGEGLHRTLRKLKSLEHYPQLVIYFGSTQENYESIFHIDQSEKILKNYELYDSAAVLTSILIFPPLSKLIYSAERRVLIPAQIKKQDINLDASAFITYNQLLFRTFKYELAELFQLSLDKKFALLVVVPPINLQIPIHNNCLSVLTKEEKSTIKQIELLISKHNYQDAHTEALILYDQNRENGRIQQLLGETFVGIGKKEEGIKHMQLATAYDCDVWRGGHLLNSILRKELKSHGISYVDFDKYLLKYFGKNVLFFDSTFPQRIYYDKFIKQIAEKAQVILKL